MMFRTRVRPIRALVVFCLLAHSASAADEGVGGLGCIKEMLLPAYGAIARKAMSPGTVKAEASIGPGGTLAGFRSGDADRFLALEVETFIRYNTSFRSECVGKQVSLVFTFVLEGDPVVDPTARVKFRGPNEFVIISQPQSPTVDRFRVAPKKDPRH
jgi:hypothetical protein